MTESLIQALYAVFRPTLCFVLDQLYPLLFLGCLLGVAGYYFPRRVRRVGEWAAALLLLWLMVLVMNGVSRQTTRRLTLQKYSPHTTVSAPSGGETLQYSPTAAYEEIVTRKQSLTFSDERFESVGLQALPGWNGADSYYSDAVIDVKDSLERTPHATFVNRELTYSVYHPIEFEDSIVSVKLDFVPQSVAYQALYEATYRFRNPLKTKTKVRFTFPLPADSGTLTDFKLTVNGQPSDTTWEGDLEAEGACEVKVSYHNFGRGSWTYSPTHQRDKVRNLKLCVTSDNSLIKFRRDSLYPTEEGSHQWRWCLKDVITSQDICVVFPSASKLETVSKFMAFSPLAVLGFAFVPLSTGLAGPRKTGLATLAYGMGMVFTSYLCTEHSLLFSTLVGCTLGAGLALRLLGKHAWPVVLLFWLVPLTFSWPGYTGLFLTVAGMVGLLNVGSGRERS